MAWLITSAHAEDAAAPAAVTAAPAPAEASQPAATHSEAGAPGEHKGPFPPFNPATFPSQILWFVICFGLLYLLMKRVIVPQLSAIIDGRAARIAGDIGEAQRLRSASDDALRAYEKALNDARANAHGIAQKATDAAKADAEARRHAIESDLARKLAESETRIAAIKERALADVGTISEDAASAVVEALIGQQPAHDDVSAAVAAVRRA